MPETERRFSKFSSSNAIEVMPGIGILKKMGWGVIYIFAIYLGENMGKKGHWILWGGCKLREWGLIMVVCV